MKSIKQILYLRRIIILIIILTPVKSGSQVLANQPAVKNVKDIESRKRNIEVGIEEELHKDTAHLESKYLKLIIANNKAYGKVHKAGYSGISELYIKSEDEKNLFVPLYAGFNYEHIFSGDINSYKWNAYETRIAPIELIRLSDRKVELQQSRTEHWPLKSSISYALTDNSIDFLFSGTPLENIWNKHGYIGIFFASYINEPSERGINFIGKSRTETRPRWIYQLPEVHGLLANHRPAGSKWDPNLDTVGFPISLVSGFSNYEYVYPFYYGVCNENVFIIMFDSPGKEAEIRFAQSPDGGGNKNPAWDFIYFRKNYKVGKKFSFRARAVFKKFEGRDDVIKTYELWSGKKVIKP